MEQILSGKQVSLEDFVPMLQSDKFIMITHYQLLTDADTTGGYIQVMDKDTLFKIILEKLKDAEKLYDDTNEFPVYATILNNYFNKQK